MTLQPKFKLPEAHAYTTTYISDGINKQLLTLHFNPNGNEKGLLTTD